MGCQSDARIIIIIRNNNVDQFTFTVTQLQFGIFSEASTIIIKFILEKLDKVADSARCFLLLALKYLCGVKGGLPVADQTVLLSMLKSIAPPEMPKGNNLGTEKESPKSESKRSRFDLSSAIMQQLINPLDITGSMSWAPLSEDPSDCSVRPGIFIIFQCDS